MRRFLLLLIAVMLCCPWGSAEGISCRVDLEAEGTAVSPTLWGIFLEDINHAADGGLCAELVKNGSFEYGSAAAQMNKHGWRAEPDVTFTIGEGAPFALHPNNPHYAVIFNQSDAPAGIVGSGYLDGMAVRAGEAYNFSLFCCSGALDRVHVSLEDTTGTVYAETDIHGINEEMQQLSAVLVPEADCSRNLRLALRIPAGYELWVDMVSLMPADTYAGLPVRKDLGELLEALHPSFLRFPGGCVIEGRSPETMYSWKASIGGGEMLTVKGVDYGAGHPALRPQGQCIWQGTVAYPNYTTYRLGFYEYFCLCEALNCLPVPVLNAGMTCPVQSPQYIVYPMSSPEFKQCVQDALDLAEFCRGGADTRWGAVRIAMGHPEPFPLPYLAIGNEQWQSEYFDHYLAFVEAFAGAAEEQPEIYGGITLMVANGPTSASGQGWDYVDGWCPWDDPLTGLVDEHFYEPPEWFLSHTDRYDHYDRCLAAKVFLGEYASQSNRWISALSEAAFMTGIERNGDVVAMACYAPLFGNSTHNQWAPDLIWFNNTSAWGSANYQVQKLFMDHRVARVLPLTLAGDGLYGSAGVAENGDLVLKWVNAGDEAVTLEATLDGDDPAHWAPEGTLTLLHADSPEAVVTREEPDLITPETQPVTVENGVCACGLPAWSVAVLVVPAAP